MLRRILLAFALALAAVPLAAAQPAGGEGVEFVTGGAPGVTVLVDGADVAGAQSAGDALRLDPSSEANISIALSPPPGVTWDIRGFSIGLVLGSVPGRDPTTVGKDLGTNTSIPPGFTVFVNRSVDLSPFKPIGAGLFLMQVTGHDAEGGSIFAQTFYVHVVGNPILTVAGATVTVASVATGYGLWQIVQDLREIYEARQRHKKHEKEAKARSAAVNILSLAGGLDGVVNAAGNVDEHASRLQKRGAIKWTATGFGLGAVTLTWLQFLGYVPFDIGRTLVTAFTAGAVFLTVSLLTISLVKRAQRKREAAAAAAEAGATRTLTPEGPPAAEAPTPPPAPERKP
jgi:hypothetical protein